MRVLVIDNIDSFVYNLVQYVGMNGAEVIVHDNKASIKEIAAEMEAGIDAIIISPGPKRPEDAGISNHIIAEYGPHTPLLGVCLGHQCIGHVFGADIVHAKTLMHGKTSEISHNGEGLFDGMKNPFTAVRYHSLAIDESSLPEELEATARSSDGQIMAVRHRTYPIMGVQFHPESIKTEDGMRIIKNFLGGKR